MYRTEKMSGQEKGRVALSSTRHISVEEWGSEGTKCQLSNFIYTSVACPHVKVRHATALSATG